MSGTTDRAAIGPEALAAAMPSEYWTTIDLPAGAEVFHRGDVGDAFYTVVTGEVDIVAADNVRLERLGPGDAFGELALLGAGTRKATAVCATDTRLRRLERATFLTHVGHDPALTEMTIAMLGTRMQRTSAYLDYVTTWARLVTEGRYDTARGLIQADASTHADGNITGFIQSFVEMLEAVQQREHQLLRDLQELRIEFDRTRREQEVAEITETDFFRSLQQNAERMRRRMKGAGGEMGAAQEVPTPT